MAKVKIKNLDKIFDSVKKSLRETKRSEALLSEIGNFSVERIRFETRRGRTMVDNKSSRRLPPLKKTTKDFRKEIKESFPELVDPDFFRPNKSNVTLTGQLLKSLKFKIVKDKLIILIGGTRKISSISFTTRNEIVYRDLVELGFDFIGLDKKSQKRIKKLVLDEFRRTIKKFFK